MKFRAELLLQTTASETTSLCPTYMTPYCETLIPASRSLSHGGIHQLHPYIVNPLKYFVGLQFTGPVCLLSSHVTKLTSRYQWIKLQWTPSITKYPSLGNIRPVHNIAHSASPGLKMEQDIPILDTTVFLK